MKNTFITVIIFVALALFGLRQYVKYRVPPDIDLARLHLSDMQGQPVDLAAYKGRTLFINYFATWCGPCNREIPDLERMKQSLQKDSIVFIAISEENPVAIQRFIHRWSSSFIFLHTSERLGQYGINTIPSSYIYNSKGIELYHNIGADYWDKPEMVDKIHKMVVEGLTPVP